MCSKPHRHLDTVAASSVIADSASDSHWLETTMAVQYLASQSEWQVAVELVGTACNHLMVPAHHTNSIASESISYMASAKRSIYSSTGHSALIGYLS